jgi:UDPglucose--hexose-1-phosphate uridylyltransferase
MFKKHEEEARIVKADGKRPVVIKTEVRIDPLTGDTVRITPRRVADPPIDFDDPLYREVIEESQTDCPFCPGRIERMTPRFPDDIARGGRFTHESSVLFPNLFPYGRHSAVSTFSAAHFIEIGNFTPELYRDNLINTRKYVTRVFEIDLGVRYAAVTQNYLPSSGGTLVHPHFQINCLLTPTNYLRTLAVSSMDYVIEKGRNFWEHLIEEEERAGERLIRRADGLVWLTPFAPRGKREVWAIFEDRSDFRELSDDELLFLSRGIVAVQRYWRDCGDNAFNLGIYSIAGAAGSYRLLVRMLVRTRYAPFARNDQSYFEVILGEAATDEPPEQIAADVGKYFE